MKKVLFSLLLSSAALAVQPAIASDLVPAEGIASKSTLARVNKIYVDQSEHSASSCVMGTQEHLKLAQKRRILALAGGGIRGIYEAVLLSFMEELLNKGNQGPWRRIADQFDVIGGTSTGSLLAAGLAYKSPLGGVAPFKAIELLQLYVRYGFKIFDDQARLDQGAVRAKYGNEGLDDLLSIFFGDEANLEQVSKPLYVIAHQVDTNKALVHSTRNKATATTPGSNYLLKKALGESTAAPYYFPGRIMTINGKKYTVDDGGIVANQPIEEMYNRELILDEQNEKSYSYELFAFGTGDAKPSALSQARASQVTSNDLDRGAASAVDILGGVFAGQVNGVIDRMTTEVHKQNSKATFFAHINPKVDKDYMDDTSPAYAQYMIQKVFDLVRHSSKDKASALALMLQRLDLQLPEGEELDGLIGNLTKRIYQISLDTYNNIMGGECRPEANLARVELEKAWLKRICVDCDTNGVKASTVDFLNYVNPEGIPGFSNQDRICFLLKAQDSVQPNWVQDYYAFNNKISEVEADKFLAKVDWSGQAWIEQNASLATTLVRDFNALYDPKTDNKSVISYLQQRFKSAESCLAQADNKTRRLIFENLIVLGKSIKKEGYAFCEANNQLQGWGQWGVNCLRSATRNPGTALASAATLLYGTTPLGLVVGASAAAYRFQDIASSIKSIWAGEKPAPEGTASYELFVGYMAYLEALRNKYGIDE